MKKLEVKMLQLLFVVSIIATIISLVGAIFITDEITGTIITCFYLVLDILLYGSIQERKIMLEWEEEENER